MHTPCTRTPKKLNRYFPGLAVLVKFFDVAASGAAITRWAGAVNRLTTSDTNLAHRSNELVVRPSHEISAAIDILSIYVHV